MKIFGLTVTRAAAPPVLSPPSSGAASGGWWPVIREPFAGAWQRNQEVRIDTALSNVTVYRCINLISGDIAKLRVRLVQQYDDLDVWLEAYSAAFSPVLEKPNNWQTHVQFWEQWIASKLNWGNTYVLKQRDGREVVTKLYVLAPQRVQPLVAPDGSVYYNLKADPLSRLTEDVTVPASEIIHDRMCAWFHPLVGLPPLYAAGLAALQGLTIQKHSTDFFKNGARPGGILTAPGHITDETANRIKEAWAVGFTGANVGRVAILGDGVKYDALTIDATNSQLIEQGNWTASMICVAYGVPGYMVGVGDLPRRLSVEGMGQVYYSQTIQYHLENAEACLREGLGLPPKYDVEFDLGGLLRMDTPTLVKSVADAVGAGIMKPNEGRERLNLKPAAGGDTPYLQVQNYSLAALDARDRAAPAPTTIGGPPAAPDPPPEDTPSDNGGNGDDSEDEEETTTRDFVKIVRASIKAADRHEQRRAAASS